MDDLALIARFVLAGVFVLSAAAKLVDRTGARRAVHEFGVPPAAAGIVSALLPIAELAVAVGLIPGTSARVATLAALGLLAAFTFGISANLIAGRRPECHCFGNLSSKPIGASSLLRNLALLALAAFATMADGADAGGSVPNAVRRLDSLGLAAAAIGIVAALGTGVVLLRRSSSGIGVADESLAASHRGLEVGVDAPRFALPDPSGRAVSLDDLLSRGNDVLLVFVSMNCNACVSIAPDLARWQRAFPERLTVTIASSGSSGSVLSQAETYDFAELLVDEGRELARRYESNGTPTAVLIDRHGKIAAPLAAGEGQIAGLLLRAFGWDETVAELAEGADHGSVAQDDAVIGPEEIDTSFVPAARDRVAMASRDGESVLVDPVTGLVHLLNPTAALVWRCLDGSGNVEEIARDLADVFGRDEAEVRGLVLELVRGFGRQGLLTGVETSSPTTVSS
jgi:peroxiredoxin/uncharacterized membrane protein YphA (DoxX/SURF4 family)